MSLAHSLAHSLIHSLAHSLALTGQDRTPRPSPLSVTAPALGLRQ